MRAAPLVAVLIAATPALADVAVLREIRPIVSADYTRLVFDTDRRVEYSLREVAGDPADGVPPRLYIDFNATRVGPTLAPRLAPAGGPLLRMRAAQLPGNVTRVILDVPGLRAHRAFPLLDPFRLVVDVEGDARPVAATSASPFEKGGSRGISVQGAVAKSLLTPPSRRGEPTPSSPKSAERSAPPARRPRIVLDPGHGGKDPGALGADGVAEKDIVLDLARRLAPALEAAGFEVLLTRDRDVFLSLEERTARANAAHADLFVSLHANASEDRAASGIETYYLSNSNDRATRRLAHMENQLAYMTGRPPADSDVSWILSDMIQSYKVEQSSRLAGRLQAALVAEARKSEPGIRDLGVKPGPFFVLVGAGMPAVLVEIGFVTNQREARRIGEAVYQSALAAGLVYGIGRFVDADVAATL